jgi:hypothetical protein
VLTWCHRIYATLLSRLRDHGQSAFPMLALCSLPCEFHEQWPEINWPTKLLHMLYRRYGDPNTNVLSLRREPLCEELLAATTVLSASDGVERLVDLLGLFGFAGSPSLRWFLGELHHVEVGPHLRGPVRCLPPLSSDASAATLLNSMLCTAEEISAAYLRAGIILLPTAPRQSSATSHRVTLTT